MIIVNENFAIILMADYKFVASVWIFDEINIFFLRVDEDVCIQKMTNYFSKNCKIFERALGALYSI